MRILISLFVAVLFVSPGLSQEQPMPAENLAVWPGLAPDETSSETGNDLPTRKEEMPPITRTENIRKPTLDVFPADNPNGCGVLILPGGGFGRVVPDMEGSEAAAILNRIGITAFVLRYRTKKDASDSGWKRPLQDAQRTMKFIRANSEKWKLDDNKIGLLGFSAGGQVAARLLTDNGQLAYHATDEVDKLSHRPDFSMLVYPWNMYDTNANALLPEIKANDTVPPTFIVHTNNDRSSSLGSVLFYADLKKAGIDAELHVYQSGGHGYGTRSRQNSNIGTWSDRMVDWLETHQLKSKNAKKNSGLLALRKGNRWVVPVAESGPTRIPRVCASLKSAYFVGMPDKSVVVHPEIQYWELRFKGKPLAPNVVLEFDSYPYTLEERKPATQLGDGTITVRCSNGLTSGEKLRFEPQPHKNTIGYWAVQSDSVTWPVEISQPHTFNVGMLLGAGEKGGGVAKVSLLSGDRVVDSFEFKVPVTGHFQNFVWNHAGELAVEEAGQYTLKIEAVKIDQIALMDVRQIHFSPMPPK